MTTRFVRSMIWGILATAIACLARAEIVKDAANLGPVAVDRSQVRKLHSTLVGQDYLLKIQLPDGYEKGNRTYPVLVLLDGDYHFGTAADVVQMLKWGWHVPPMIVVSPAYGSVRLPHEGGANMRMRDYALTADRSEPPSGADAFLAFVKDELLPYVDANFRTTPGDRTLWGYSMSARFVLGALFREPGLFKRYIAVDGIEESVVELEQAYFAKRHELPAIVFVCGRQGNPRMKAFADVLQSRNYAGLRVRYADLSDSAHFAIGAEGLSRGLKAVFEGDPSLPSAATVPPVADVLLPILDAKGVGAAQTEYERLRRTAPDDYRFDLIPLVRTLLARDRAQQALELAQYNVEQDPMNLPGSYVVLADTHRKLGHRDLAIENYRKALRANSTNQGARRALAELGEAVP